YSLTSSDRLIADDREMQHLSLANSNLRPESDFFVLLACHMRDLTVLLVHLIATVVLVVRPGAFAFCPCRVRSHEASAPDRESLPPLCTQPPRLRSADRWILFCWDQAESAPA